MFERDINKKYEVRIIEEKNLIWHTVGHYSSYNKALAVKSKLLQEGYSENDVVIINRSLGQLKFNTG